MASQRVLHLHFGKDGGAERFFVNLVNAFGERGVEQKFIIRPGRIWLDEIAHLGEVTENAGRRFMWSGLLLSWKLRRLIREWQPDAIMAWMPRAASFIPDVKGPIKLTRLGDFPRHLNHFGHCDVLVGNIPGIARHCVDMGWKRPIRTISNFPREIIPNPVSRSVLDTPDDAFVIANAGRFVPRKGFDLLVRAAARVPDAWLWLIGDGQERKALEDLARAEGILDRTRFVGWVEEPIHYLASTNVLAMPSRHEPLGNVILEAWRADVPVVSTRSEGPSWYMTDEENGLLTPIDDLEALVAAIRRVQTVSGLGERLRAGGQQRLTDYFSKDRIVDQYLALFSGHLEDEAKDFWNAGTHH